MRSHSETSSSQVGSIGTSAKASYTAAAAVKATGREHAGNRLFPVGGASEYEGYIHVGLQLS